MTATKIYLDTDRFPECKKLLAIKDKSQTIGEFLDWLTTEKGYSICRSFNTDFISVSLPIHSLLAEFFDIDLKEVEKEQQQILEEHRQPVLTATK